MIPVSEISRRLAERALTVCLMLLPGGREQRAEFVCGGITGGEGDSLKVHLSGSHAGHWKDWAIPEHHGDLLDLWAITKNISPGDALREAKTYLGITDPVPVHRKTYSKPPERKEVPLNPIGRAFTYLTEKRRLTKATLDAFRICPFTGETPAIVFPSYSPDGELVNRSYRTLEDKKRVWQDKDCAPSLFGWQALPREAFDNRTVLLSEGQIDAMTWHQWGIPSLSIPSGSGQTWIEYDWDNLALFDKIYIAFDTDGAGRENAEKAIKRLGTHRCFIVATGKHKDANDALKAGVEAEEARSWIAAAKHPKVSGLIVANDLRERLLAEIAEKPKPFTLGFFDKDWRFQHGLYFRSGEVTLWTGVSHAGKSTFLNFLVLGVLAQNVPVFIGSLEVKPETTLRKLATATLSTLGMKRDATGFNSWLVQFGDLLVFADVVGFIEQDRLFEMMRFAFSRFGVQHFVIDSMMRIAGLEEDFPSQGVFMNRLQEFVKDTGTHVHLVVHPRKGQAGGKPGMLDVKGSSLIPNNADNIVVVARNEAKMALSKERELDDDEKQWHDTEVTVEKQRESGWLGTFYLRFNPYQFTFTPCAKAKLPEPERRKKSKFFN